MVLNPRPSAERRATLLRLLSVPLAHAALAAFVEWRGCEVLARAGAGLQRAAGRRGRRAQRA